MPAEKRCREEANRMMRDEVKKRVNRDGSETPEMTLHCLPDTVDPRGPKGK